MLLRISLVNFLYYLLQQEGQIMLDTVIQMHSKTRVFAPKAEELMLGHTPHTPHLQ